MKHLWVVPLLLCFCLPLCAETLHDFLSRNGIPESKFTAAQLAQTGSGIAQQFAGSTVVAFLPESTNLENAALRVVRYEPSRKTFEAVNLTGDDISSECVNPILDMTEFAGRLFLVTHINPSASCTVMLNANDLALQGTFFGWPDAHVGDSGVVFEEDQVHFQPVHDLHLHFVDLEKQSAVEVYPPDNDPQRAQFSNELKKHLPSRQWCGENNNPCDVSRFEDEMRFGPESTADGSSFAFIVAHSADGFGDQAIDALGDRYVLYIYRKTFNGWFYCERALDGGEPDTISAQLKTDYANATKSCSKFLRVIVKPKGSPFSKFQIKPASDTAPH